MRQVDGRGEAVAPTTARAQLAAMLERWGGRPTLLAVTVINVVSFIVITPYIAAANFGLDSINTYRMCAVQLTQGVAFCGSPYPPMASVALLPLAMVPPLGAALLMTLLGALIAVVGVVIETRGHARVDRLMVGISVLTFTPVVYELLLGQITLVIAAAMYPLVRRPDRFRNGIGMGLVVALAPKVLIVPFLFWMLVWRRQALGAAILTALVLTAVGVAWLGFDAYRAWFSLVTGSGQSSLVGWLSSRDMGNLSLWPLEPVTIATAVFVGVATLVAIVQDESRGFVASLLGGLLLAPYTLLYGYLILLLAVKPALAFAPRATRALALTVNFAHPALPSILWTLAALVTCISRRRSPEAPRLRMGRR